MKKLDLSLYVISGQHLAQGRELLAVMEAALVGGATVIQLREKNLSGRELVAAGLALKELAHRYGATFIVNDRVDIALAVDADGVHLGQDDLPVTMARQIMGPDKIIGLSTHSWEQALAASKLPVDYIGVGPVFPTSSKPDAEKPVGLSLVQRVARELSVPFVAIGGINAGNIQQVLAAGARNVAVISAVVAAPDVTAAARELKNFVAGGRKA
ncbi:MULTISPECIES: thiamine phosphate synthase [Carboxydocella]|uniref:Thiamine-phosphate synthase n=2 Tax=Carboxydocella TaxID=178898 RepID=A0A1T4NLV8_9FIRM|nr:MULTISPECIES: thiamine phosphate synthase [Carboxydocella]AVX20102.1 thiamine-phosphate diphosphorylase [Carboxydocella thermautotrophica]AVX30519.1 thiamine-phosphate diphosphorylase [Carboxydocella thermautotrophica]SJZ80192.1 thiamine-phosphate diphosphorylase [Carboxydocella sporoproducens DSM 16521]GAW29191.1 thiamine phosphate synthase [Carboxydocella sp. ULO1]GAW31749.1 thiamine phosphate synthase [Carboxydocella sp. JDF658]